MKKAVFLDRDGVINRERGEYTFREADFEILPDVFDFLNEIHQRNYLIIIVTNQGGIGKSLYSHNDFLNLNTILNNALKSIKIQVADVFYCPHFPENTGKCLCRKPDSVLFEKAIAKHNINVLQSYMIGDKERDIIPAKKVGLKTFQIEANTSLKNILPLLP